MEDIKYSLSLSSIIVLGKGFHTENFVAYHATRRKYAWNWLNYNKLIHRYVLCIIPVTNL